MKLLRDESGQVIALTVLCMAVLLGSVAFAVDIGILLRARRVLQTAADSAAIAAAAELAVDGDYTDAAVAAAAQNGVINGDKIGTTVTANNPPKSGPFAGPNPSYYAQVIVSQPQKSFFIGYFNQNSVTVSASAVATLVPSKTCLYTLSPTPGIAGIYLTNGAGLNLPTCGILDNGDSSISVSQGSSISATSVGTFGSDSGDITPNPVALKAAVADPLSFLTPPTIPLPCLPNPLYNNGTASLGPATPGGTVCYSGLSLSNGTVNLNPGVYIIDGANVFISNETLTGTGVTLYFVGGTFQSSFNNVNFNLTAPTSGPYSGILIYQDPSDTQSMNFNGISGTASGIFYLPTAQVAMTGSGSSTLNASLVVGSLSCTANVVITLAPYTPLTGLSPLSTAVLAE